ncbi:sugar ABC transporter permease [Paenibacillus montaniterrae]|uniref:Sugar ABC transporter permease n=1 Tax=Paenibacillus montaniterrae TaxID=429341 RepID=A0A919YW23_9BACL|nr:carbohydrate ABC transporter permease [Paenibacillus montaniterrae]GIP17853.1 sugar ABC transporter permease [Paenibacillus montaniterrae]
MLRFIGKLLLACFAGIIIAPLLIVVFTTFKTNAEFYANPLSWPAQLTLDNLQVLFAKQTMWRYFWNSTLVTFVTVALELLLAGSIAYAIMRYGKSKIGAMLFSLFAVGLMIPSQVNMIPIYTLLRDLSLTNSHAGLILVTLTILLPLSVFMLTGFVKTLPKELLEAGEIDGAGEFRLFTQIVVPLIAPYLATTAAFLFVIVWNDLLFPMLLLVEKGKLTLPLALIQFKGEYITNYPLLMTGVIVTALPMIVMFVFLQRYFIAGALAGSLKG